MQAKLHQIARRCCDSLPKQKVTISAIPMTDEDGKIKVSPVAIFDKKFDEKG